LDQIKAEIKSSIPADDPLLNTDLKKDELVAELAPRIKLRDEKELKAATASSEKKKLAELLEWVEIKYDGKTAANDGRFTEINTKITELEKYLKDDGTEESKLVKGWDSDDKKILEVLKTKMVSRRDAMKKLRETNEEVPNNMKPLIVLSIIAGGLGLL